VDEFHFLRPFWLLVMLPALFIWWRLWKRQDEMTSWHRIVDPHLIKDQLVGGTSRGGLRPVQLLLVVWLVTAVALAGPSWRTEPSPFADDDAGLVLLLKVSGTMLASDVQPTRLERAKQKVRDLLQYREGSRTGVIVYSGSAHLVMPLTRDDRIITAMLEDLMPKLMPVDGDALAQAMQLAEKMLSESGRPGSALVIADNVSAAQTQLLASVGTTLSVQFLSVQATSAPIDSGLQSAALQLGADIERLTVDPADVESIASRAQTRLKDVSAAMAGSRWQDAGYSLVPFLALLVLMWSRRGWLVT